MQFRLTGEFQRTDTVTFELVAADAQGAFVDQVAVDDSRVNQHRRHTTATHRNAALVHQVTEDFGRRAERRWVFVLTRHRQVQAISVSAIGINVGIDDQVLVEGNAVELDGVQVTVGRSERAIDFNVVGIRDVFDLHARVGQRQGFSVNGMCCCGDSKRDKGFL
ncbi:hypothetical protein D3C80_1267440 [compost metagenome]